MPSSLEKNLLKTGPPGCGKTTVVRRVVETLGDLHLAGFYTREVRERGQRLLHEKARPGPAAKAEGRLATSTK